MRYTGVFRRRRLFTSTVAGIGAVALLAGAGAAFVAGRPPGAAAAADVVVPGSVTSVKDEGDRPVRH